MDIDLDLIAALYLNMSPIEVIKVVTINGAKSLNKEEQIGSIEVGKKLIWLFLTLNL